MADTIIGGAPAPHESRSIPDRYFVPLMHAKEVLCDITMALRGLGIHEEDSLDAAQVRLMARTAEATAKDLEAVMGGESC